MLPTLFLSGGLAVEIHIKTTTKKGAPKDTPKGSQDTPQGAKIAPKGAQKGAKIDPWRIREKVMNALRHENSDMSRNINIYYVLAMSRHLESTFVQ